MSDKSEKDPFAPRAVKLQLFKGVSSACRLCRVRNRQQETLVVAELDGGRADFYCKYCYGHVRERLRADVDIPSFEELKTGVVTAVFLPPYLIKEKRPFLYCHPVDPIDLGLHIQRRKAQGG